MLRTKINGKWVNDPIKDLSNGQPSVSSVSIAKLQAQNAHMANILKVVQGMTKATDIQVYIRQAKASYPH